MPRKSANKVGRSGTFFETKQEYNIFYDRNGIAHKHRKNGQYGVDTSSKTPESKNYIAHEFAIGMGDYQFGKAKFEVNNAGLSFSADIEGPKQTFEINRNVAELTQDAGFDPTVVTSLRDTLQKSRLNFDIGSLRLKNIEFEGPNAGISTNFSTEKIGARASAQAASVKVILITPIGEISAKLKGGISIGSEFGFTEARSGNIGVKRSNKIGFGMWELSLSPLQVEAQNPAFFEWQSFAGASPDKLFSSLPTATAAKLFSGKQLSCQFDFDSLSKVQSTTLPASDPFDDFRNITWDEEAPSTQQRSRAANTSPQSIVSEPTSTNPTELEEIPPTATRNEAKQTLQNNLQQFDLKKSAIAEDLDRLNFEEIKKINRALIEVCTNQAKTLQEFVFLKKENEKQKLEQAETAAFSRLVQGADGLMQLGHSTGCRPLVVIGSIIQCSKQIIEAFHALAQSGDDAKAMGNVFGPLAALAPLGPIGILAGAFSILLNLMSSPQKPDPTEVMIGKLNQLLKGQEEIKDLLITVRDEQAVMLRTLSRDIHDLKLDLEQRFTALRFDFNETFQRIEQSIQFLTEFTRLALRDQFLQDFHHHCQQAALIHLTQGREAETLLRNISRTLLSDSKNDMITGYAEIRAGSTQADTTKVLTKVFSHSMSKESSDQHLNFLLGNIYQQPMLNPLLWHQAAQEYITLSQRFFALYMEESDIDLAQAITLGNDIEADWDELETTDVQQELITQYYSALTKVNSSQLALIQQFNIARTQHHNQAYLKSGYARTGMDEINFLMTPDTLINAFAEFDEEYQTYKYGFSHLQAKLVGKSTDSLQVIFNPYPGKNSDAFSDRAFDVNLHQFVDRLRRKPTDDSTPRTRLNLIFCAEYLGLLTIKIEAQAMNYPNIPTTKHRDALHAREIVVAHNAHNTTAIPGYYFLQNENESYELDIALGYDDSSCELILSAILPKYDEMDNFLINAAAAAYVITNYESTNRIYYICKEPREFTQVIGVPEELIVKLRDSLISINASKRLLTGDELTKLNNYQPRKNRLRVQFTGTYNEFNNPIMGIEECSGGYKEPPSEDESFHKKLRTQIPKLVEANWRKKNPKLTLADDEVDRLQKKIEVCLLSERKLLANMILTNHSDDPQLLAFSHIYHAALDELDNACIQLQTKLYLAGQKLDTPLINSASILREIHDNAVDLSKSDLTPSLTIACALESNQQINPTDFSKMETITAFHPRRLLKGTLAQLRTHQRWRDWMRTSYPWLKYKDVQQYWTGKIFSNLERLSQDLYAQYKDLKTDINGLAYAKARLNHADTSPITSETDYQSVYNATYDWSIVHAKNSLVTGFIPGAHDHQFYEEQLNLTLLKRGWADNIAFLMQYSSGAFDLKIDADQLVNFTFWCDGALQFCKLLDYEIGPYKTGYLLAQSAKLTPEIQMKAIDMIAAVGEQLNTAITSVAFSETLFEELFNRYLAVLDSLQIMVDQTSGITDDEIIRAMLPDDFMQRRPNAGSFLQIQGKLNITSVLIECYLEMAFPDIFSDLFKNAIFDGTSVENQLRNILNEPDSKNITDESLLKAHLKNLRLKVCYMKATVLETICYNRSVNYFAQRLEHYFDSSDSNKSDALYITEDFLLVGGEMQNHIALSESHLELIDQFLERNTHIIAFGIWGIHLEQDFVQDLVLLLKDHYPVIKKLTLAGAGLKPEALPLLFPLLPQLIHLDLRGNLLGTQSEDIYSKRFNCLLPLLELGHIHLTYLGLAQNNLSEIDMDTINGGLLMNTMKQGPYPFNLDITGNVGITPLDITNVHFINSEKDSANHIRQNMTVPNKMMLTLKPTYHDFGQPHLGQVLTILSRTKQILHKQNIANIGLSGSGTFHTRPNQDAHVSSDPNRNDTPVGEYK